MKSHRAMGIVWCIKNRRIKVKIPNGAVEQTKSFFFRAMRLALSLESGWSGQTFSHQEGGLLFSGMLEINDDSKSTSFVRARMNISFKGTQIWFMRYNGRCRNRDLPFLRHVLLDACARRKFFAGRERIHYERKPRVYEDKLSSGQFEAFYGFGKVLRVPQEGGAVYWVTSRLSYAGGLIHG